MIETKGNVNLGGENLSLNRKSLSKYSIPEIDVGSAAVLHQTLEPVS